MTSAAAFASQLAEPRAGAEAESTASEAEAIRLVDGVLHRDRLAIAQALNLLEDRRPWKRPLQHALLRRLPPQPVARRVGVTGPPGAGKSTLCAALARAFRRRGDHVGVVAVDPSSIQSGGALLGDRVRIVSADPDPGLFVRSLAAGEELGGLARTAPACIDLLSSACDMVLIETVGVGQSEIEIANVADLTVVVVQPASGDALQFLKAGLLEIPDILVVNKSDLGDVARRAESDLRHALTIAAQAGVSGGSHAGEAARPPVVLRASGASGEHIDDVVEAILQCAAHLQETGALARRRHQGGINRVITAVARRIGEVGIEALGGRAGLRLTAATALSSGVPVVEVCDTLVSRAVAAIRES